MSITAHWLRGSDASSHLLNWACHACLSLSSPRRAPPDTASLLLQTAAATSRVGTSMATATKAMQAAGIASDPRKVQQTMMEFSKENAKMEAAQGGSGAHVWQSRHIPWAFSPSAVFAMPWLVHPSGRMAASAWLKAQESQPVHPARPRSSSSIKSCFDHAKS